MIRSGRIPLLVWNRWQFNFPTMPFGNAVGLREKRLDSLLSYWREMLDQAPVLNVPTDAPRPLNQSYSGARHDFQLPSELCRQLAEFNRREHVTPFMSLLAAYEVLLSRYSAQEDFLIGTPVANRGSVEAEQMIGLFVNSRRAGRICLERPTFARWWPVCVQGARCIPAPGVAFRPACSGTLSTERLKPPSAFPGDVCLAERAAASAGAVGLGGILASPAVELDAF